MADMKTKFCAVCDMATSHFWGMDEQNWYCGECVRRKWDAARAGALGHHMSTYATSNPEGVFTIWVEGEDTLTDLCRGAFPNGHPDFIPMCLGEMDLHSRKNADYAGAGEALRNFYSVAKQLDESPAFVALTYMLKQVDAVTAMIVEGREGAVEGLDSRLQDIGVYSKLIRILLKEAE